MRAFVVKKNTAKLVTDKITTGTVRFFSTGELAALAKKFDIIIYENRNIINIEFSNKGTSNGNRRC